MATSKMWVSVNSYQYFVAQTMYNKSNDGLIWIIEHFMTKFIQCRLQLLRTINLFTLSRYWFLYNSECVNGDMNRFLEWISQMFRYWFNVIQHGWMNLIEMTLEMHFMVQLKYLIRDRLMSYDKCTKMMRLRRLLGISISCRP